MRVVSIAARRSLLGLPHTVVVRAGAALADALVVFTGVALGLWLLLGLISLRPAATSGMM